MQGEHAHLLARNTENVQNARNLSAVVSRWDTCQERGLQQAADQQGHAKHAGGSHRPHLGLHQRHRLWCKVDRGGGQQLTRFRGLSFLSQSTQSITLRSQENSGDAYVTKYKSFTHPRGKTVQLTFDQLADVVRSTSVSSSQTCIVGKLKMSLRNLQASFHFSYFPAEIT
jgi:hypothetical protein